MRRVVASLAIAATIAALPQVAIGLLVWTFVVVPLTVTAGQSTVFTMTATNVLGPDDLGCMEVSLPASFAIQSVGDPAATNGDDWAATVSGTTVEVRSLSGGGRLEIGESVTFQVMARPSTAGLTLWPNHAHRQQDCSGLTEVGVPVEVVVLPQLLPTPTPKPAPTATPRPTATARPTALPSLPISLPPLPTIVPSATSAPTSAPTARPTAGASEEPRPSGSAPMSTAPSPTPAPNGGGVSPPPSVGGSTTNDGSAPPAPRISPDRVPVQVGTGTLTVLDGFDTWSVPAAVVGVPGLLVVLWVALQTVGALAWIPAVRRLRGNDGARRVREAR